MRKLKLQMQVSLDGFVARPNGELDWMTWGWDDELKNYVSELTDSCDTILMGRKMTGDFVKYWTSLLANPENPDYPFAQRMVDYQKVVFTKTLDSSSWANTVLAKGDLVEEVNKRKNESGKDIIVYGGAGFASSLIKEDLIDEYHFFVNPTAIGSGRTIFENQLDLTLVKNRTFDCGVVALCYRPK